jgi:GNAT superfamily N-acetyltransferase
MQITRTYLELVGPEVFRPSWSAVAGIGVDRVDACTVELYRRLYVEVGGQYGWVDQLEWTDGQISRHLADAGVSIWVMTVEGRIAGYFELRAEPAGSTELAYFGLLPEYVGRGLGKHLLSAAVERAFESGASRVWLHTCTRDHPAALPNYLARGFVPFKSEIYEA